MKIRVEAITSKVKKREDRLKSIYICIIRMIQDDPSYND